MRVFIRLHEDMNYGQINYSTTENMIDILFVNTNSLDKTFQSLSKYRKNHQYGRELLGNH